MSAHNNTTNMLDSMATTGHYQVELMMNEKLAWASSLSARDRDQLDFWLTLSGPDVQFRQPLLHALGAIPPLLFERSEQPQLRWDQTGNEVAIKIPEFQNITLCRRYITVNSDMAKLASSGIQQASEFEDVVTKYVYGLNTSRWNSLAFKLLCYVFPRDAILEPNFGQIGEELLPVLLHVLDLCKKPDHQTLETRDYVETLLAASNFGSMATRKHLLQLAKSSIIHQHNDDLYSQVVLQESILLRLEDNIPASLKIIDGYFQTKREICDVRADCYIGRLHCSQAENFMSVLNPCRAEAELAKWGPSISLTTLSIFRIQTLRLKLLQLALAFEAHGDYKRSMESLELCLRYEVLHFPHRRLIVSTLVHVYLELHFRAGPTFYYLSKADLLLGGEMEPGLPVDHQSRWLHLLSLDVLMLQNREIEAAKLVKLLLASYELSPEQKIQDRIGYLQTLIAAATMASPGLAIQAWNEVLHWMQHCNETGFDVGATSLILDH